MFCGLLQRSTAEVGAIALLALVLRSKRLGVILICLLHQKQAQACKVILELDLIAVENTEVIHISQYLMCQSD